MANHKIRPVVKKIIRENKDIDLSFNEYSKLYTQVKFNGP